MKLSTALACVFDRGREQGHREVLHVVRQALPASDVDEIESRLTERAAENESWQAIAGGVPCAFCRQPGGALRHCRRIDTYLTTCADCAAWWAARGFPLTSVTPDRGLPSDVEPVGRPQSGAMRSQLPTRAGLG